jgi:hypothetical protein
MNDELLKLYDALYAPQAWFLSLSPYISMSIVGLMVTGMLGCAGFALARMGYKPLWALLLLAPTISVAALWVVAFLPFPREKQTSENYTAQP